MMADIYPKLHNKLLSAGWFEGRNIENEFTGSVFLDIYPINVLNIFKEFGGLKLYTDFVFENLDFDIKHFKKKDFKPCLFDEINNIIDLDNGTYQNYYYSVLIGTNLYKVSSVSDGLGMYIDKLGNVYHITSITELCWVASNIIDGLYSMLFGCDHFLIFNENTLTWMGRVNEEIKYYPPINKNIKENPWG